MATKITLIWGKGELEEYVLITRVRAADDISTMKQGMTVAS